MATINDSIKAKKDALAAAVTDAQALIDDVNADPEMAKTAMDKVKTLQNDLAQLKELENISPAESDEPVPDDVPASDSATSATPADSNVAPAPAAPASEPKDKPAQPASGDTPNSDEPAIDDPEDKKKKENREMPIPIDAKKPTETRDLLNSYLHSKGERRDDATAIPGVKSTDVGVTIPEDIIYEPENELKTVVDLAQLVTKTKVTTGSGKYPILKRADAVMHTVEELKEAPELANPEFIDVNYEVATYRGQIPISQEAIDDSAIDLVGLVGRHAQTIKINTTNAAISTILAGFTAKTLTQETLVDDLKHILNVDLDPAYKRDIVVTQSLYNVLDTMKDAEGRYLLQDQIGVASGKALSGNPITAVEDTAFGGADGSTQAFIGDLARAVLFADRADLGLEWVQYPIYGRILEPVMRFDVKQADDQAGFFATLAPKA